MEKPKITRKPGGIVVLGGKTVAAAECCEIDHGKQGTSRVYIIEKPPATEQERKMRQQQVNRALHEMWLSVQMNRAKQAEQPAL